MVFKLEQVLREFEFSDQNGTPEGNQVFDAVVLDEGGKPTNFTRRITSIEEPWTNSCIVMDKHNVIGSGEDPRPFFWKGSPCISAVTFSLDHGYINKIFVKNLARWIPIFYFDGGQGGKNWMPFVRDDELYFVHGFSPFRVLKAEYLHENDDFMVVRNVAEHYVRLPKSRDRYPWLRGGSNAVQIGEMVVGIGHTNECRGKTHADTWHRPFVFVYTPDVSLDYYSMNCPFPDEFRIIDPTSLYISDGRLFMVTSETERVWSIAPQKGRTCLYSTSLVEEPDESSFSFGGRRLHRWTSDQPSKVRRLLGSWRRHQGA